MTVIIDSITGKQEEVGNVWEIQDNGCSYIVLKFHDHSCKRIEKSSVLNIGVIYD